MIDAVDRLAVAIDRRWSQARYARDRFAPIAFEALSQPLDLEFTEPGRGCPHVGSASAPPAPPRQRLRAARHHAAPRRELRRGCPVLARRPPRHPRACLLRRLPGRHRPQLPHPLCVPAPTVHRRPVGARCAGAPAVGAPRPRATVPIVEGPAFIHAAFHTDTPSMTIVVRTHDSGHPSTRTSRQVSLRPRGPERRPPQAAAAPRHAGPGRPGAAPGPRRADSRGRRPLRRAADHGAGDRAGVGVRALHGARRRARGPPRASTSSHAGRRCSNPGGASDWRRCVGPAPRPTTGTGPPPQPAFPVWLLDAVAHRWGTEGANRALGAAATWLLDVDPRAEGVVVAAIAAIVEDVPPVAFAARLGSFPPSVVGDDRSELEAFYAELRGTRCSLRSGLERLRASLHPPLKPIPGASPPPTRPPPPAATDRERRVRCCRRAMAPGRRRRRSDAGAPAAGTAARSRPLGPTQRRWPPPTRGPTRPGWRQPRPQVGVGDAATTRASAGRSARPPRRHGAAPRRPTGDGWPRRSRQGRRRAPPRWRRARRPGDRVPRLAHGIEAEDSTGRTTGSSSPNSSSSCPNIARRRPPTVGRRPRKAIECVHGDPRSGELTGALDEVAHPACSTGHQGRHRQRTQGQRIVPTAGPDRRRGPVGGCPRPGVRRQWSADVSPGGQPAHEQLRPRDPGRHGRRRHRRARPSGRRRRSTATASSRSATCAGAAAASSTPSGRLVTPGFVDIHTHLDAQLAWDPIGTSSCWHGVTSVVIGQLRRDVRAVQARRTASCWPR